jgi:hypothetical protein
MIIIQIDLCTCRSSWSFAGGLKLAIRQISGALHVSVAHGELPARTDYIFSSSQQWSHSCGLSISRTRFHTHVHFHRFFARRIFKRMLTTITTPTSHCIANVESSPGGVDKDPMVALELSGAHQT